MVEPARQSRPRPRRHPAIPAGVGRSAAPRQRGRRSQEELEARRREKPNVVQRWLHARLRTNWRSKSANCGPGRQPKRADADESERPAQLPRRRPRQHRFYAAQACEDRGKGVRKDAKRTDQDRDTSRRRGGLKTKTSDTGGAWKGVGRVVAVDEISVAAALARTARRSRLHRSRSRLRGACAGTISGRRPCPQDGSQSDRPVIKTLMKMGSMVTINQVLDQKPR